MADLIERDALEQFYESGTDPKDTYADMTFIRAEHIDNAPAVNLWIPVEDALPEIKEFHISDTVLCYCDSGALAIARLEENGFGQVGLTARKMMTIIMRQEKFCTGCRFLKSPNRQWRLKMKIVEKRPAMERFDYIVNRWKEQLMQGQTDTNELVFRLRDFVQTEVDINRIKSNRWISCSERMPNETGEYLVCGKWYGEKSKTWICQFKIFGDIGGFLNPAKNPPISFWMPMPDAYEPPEKE